MNTLSPTARLVEWIRVRETTLMALTFATVGPRRGSFNWAASEAHPCRALRALSTCLSRSLPRFLVFALFFAIAISIAGGAAAESASKSPASMQSLDEQVQEVKSDVLAIAAELSNLEEQLLYPSNTQIAVFVSIEEGHQVALDSARISIDGELVTQHIYSFKELEALQKGGVQRIYTGNVRTGEHRIEVAIAGKRSGGKNFDAVETFVFSKAVKPKLVGIQLAGQSSGDATIAIKDW
jgi:hypothetical protein